MSFFSNKASMYVTFVNAGFLAILSVIQLLTPTVIVMLPISILITVATQVLEYNLAKGSK